jgi:hemoglobin
MNRVGVLTFAAVFVLIGCSRSETEPAAQPAAEPVADVAAEPTPEEQLAAAVGECEAAQAEFEARAAESSLYDRLGGREGIRPIFAELVEILSNDPDAAAMLEGVDLERMIEVSTDHLAVHSGGSETYGGRDITEVHEPMNINAEMVLGAGEAFGAAMEKTGVAPEVAQEVQCLMIGMRDQVMASAG